MQPRLVLMFAAAGVLLGGCGERREAPAEEHALAPAAWPDPDYLDSFARFRRERTAALTAPSGWLNLVTLRWLDEGRTVVGTAASAGTASGPPTGGAAAIVLDARPQLAGQPGELFELEVAAGRVVARARPGALIEVDGEPLRERELIPEATHLAFGGLLATVIERGGRTALRVRDLSLDTQTVLPHLELFPLNRELVLTGRLELWPQPRDVPVPNVTDFLYPQRALGELLFTVAGQPVRLLVLGDDARKPLFLIVGDRTNGAETYGGGRYLYADPPGPDGRVVIDMNRLYNPPCVFTQWATCPLPPPQNKIAARLEAGEKMSTKR